MRDVLQCCPPLMFVLIEGLASGAVKRMATDLLKHLGATSVCEGTLWSCEKDRERESGREKVDVGSWCPIHKL